MTIRTDDEYRAACARLQEERVIMRSRSFTDDEQRDFDALVRDIEAYQATRSPGATAVSVPRSAERSAPQPIPVTAATQSVRAASNMMLGSASMRRELERRGMTAVAQPDASASPLRANMERQLRRDGVSPRGVA